MLKEKLTFATHNDLSEEVRAQIIQILNQQLADTFDMHSQLKQAHWNVKGMQFIALHELFDTLAESIEDQVDMIAERATALGGAALGTARMAAANSRLPEYPLSITDGQDHVKALVERMSQLAASTRLEIDRATDLGDQATADLYTGVVRDLDKHIWFLEAHIQA